MLSIEYNHIDFLDSLLKGDCHGSHIQNEALDKEGMYSCPILDKYVWLREVIGFDDKDKQEGKLNWSLGSELCPSLQRT